MSAAEHPTTPVPATGMWAPYEPIEIGEKLTMLEEVGPFVLVGVVVREGIPTSFGPKDAVDLTVQTIDPVKTRLFSGFAAGIVGQCKRLEPGNLPAVCRIVKTTGGRGETSSLELVRQLPQGVELSSIAKAMQVPISPAAVQTDEIPF